MPAPRSPKKYVMTCYNTTLPMSSGYFSSRTSHLDLLQISTDYIKDEPPDARLQTLPHQFIRFHCPNLLFQALLQRLSGNTAHFHVLNLILLSWRPLHQHALDPLIRVYETPAVRVLNYHNLMEVEECIESKDVRKGHLQVPTRISDHDDLAWVNAEKVLGDTSSIGASDYQHVRELAKGCELGDCWEWLV
jgi:hypothetical protein